MKHVKDPRYLQIALLGAYTALGQVFLQFQVTMVQIAVTLVACILLEWVFTYLKDGVFRSPASAIITGLGICLALRASTVIPFILASIVAIGLKHWLRYRGQHIFNPSNSGIVAISLLAPIAVATAPLQFGFYLYLLVAMSIAGAFLAFKVHRLSTVLTFLATFAGVQWIRLLIWPDSITAHFSTFMWGSLFVFTFNMITDPKTSSRRTRSQILYGFFIGLISQVLITLEVHGAVYISLAAICLVKAMWRMLRDRGMFSARRPSLS